jgi:hypothetical protein
MTTNCPDCRRPLPEISAAARAIGARAPEGMVLRHMVLLCGQCGAVLVADPIEGVRWLALSEWDCLPESFQRAIVRGVSQIRHAARRTKAGLN